VSHPVLPPVRGDSVTGDRVSVHSLHLWHERPASLALPCQPPPKPDRLLVGAIAGAALFYLLGRALGLGRHRDADAEH
jgi:hypothetical protein